MQLMRKEKRRRRTTTRNKQRDKKRYCSKFARSSSFQRLSPTTTANRRNGCRNVRRDRRIHSRSNRFDDLRGVISTRQIPLSHRFFDSIHFRLIPFAIFHRTFLRLFQRLFKRLHAIHRRFQTFLQFRQFAAQIGIFSNELQKTNMRTNGGQRGSSDLFVNFCQLVEIIF